jgi:hypothetical protein
MISGVRDPNASPVGVCDAGGEGLGSSANTPKPTPPLRQGLGEKNRIPFRTAKSVGGALNDWAFLLRAARVELRFFIRFNKFAHFH